MKFIKQILSTKWKGKDLDVRTLAFIVGSMTKKDLGDFVGNAKALTAVVKYIQTPEGHEVVKIFNKIDLGPTIPQGVV